MRTLRQMHVAQAAIYQLCERHPRENLSVEVGQLQSPNRLALKYTTVRPAAKLTWEDRDAARVKMYWGWNVASGDTRKQWRRAQPNKWWFNVAAYRAWMQDKQDGIDTRCSRASATLRDVKTTCDEINDLAREFYNAYGIDWRVPTVLISRASVE